MGPHKASQESERSRTMARIEKINSAVRGIRGAKGAVRGAKNAPQCRRAVMFEGFQAGP